LGTRIAALTIDQSVSLFRQQIDRHDRGYVCICTVNEIVESMRDPVVRRALEGAWLATPDGMPLVWWGQLAATGPVDRVYGPDVLRRVLVDPAHRDTRHYFYGGATPEITRKVVEAARRLNPGALIAGWSTPPFGNQNLAEAERTARAIEAARPDVVWVGLGGRKQALWMARFRPMLSASLLVGVGAAFDFLAGAKPQAPGWMQRAGMEWAFRLATEPRRLWRRYLIHNSIFVAHTLAYVAGMGRYAGERQAGR
jgi:N-acetylglucosaminyldiphosphoundecaprenol N-acetyl-beta-D-mannosaminyltransferase